MTLSKAEIFFLVVGACLEEQQYLPRKPRDEIQWIVEGKVDFKR